MAFINNLYVFVETEKVTRGVEVSSHPVEKGLSLTDNIKNQPVTISIEGQIIGEDAKTTLSKLITYHRSGKYVKYVGMTTLSNAIIETFDIDYDNTASGAHRFSMEIVEIRVANASIVASSSSSSTTSGTKQVTKSTQTKRYYTVKKGDTLWDIAKSYYGSGNYFNKIYLANKDQIKNANLIYVGQKLLIP